MTQVIFDVVDLVGEVHPGDKVSVWPPHVTATADGRVKSTRKVDVLVDEGPVTEDIEPGPLVVQLQCRGIADTKPRTVTVPDEGTVTLANLLQSTFTYTPAVVSQVSLGAQRAEDAAVRAEGVADAFGSLEGVEDLVQVASDAADRAENVVDTVQWQGDQLSVMGKVSPPLTGDAGATPHVGANDNWWVGDTDTGVRAQGPKGDSGDGAGDVLWSEINPVLDGKANVGDVPVTDGGYGTRHASDPAADYPKGVSYGLFHAGDGWDAAIQSDTGHAGSNTFVMVQTLRQGGYSLSTTQMVFTYSNVHKPVFMRKWHGEEWGPFRSLTDDGHTHSQYAESSRVTALEGSQPIIVSSLPSSPLPGRIYLVTG